MSRSVALLVLALVAVVVAAYAPAPAPQAARASVRPDSGFVNLRVLPDTIGRDALMAVMQGFRASLGVRCTHCHVREGEEMNFVSDANPHKDIARAMMRMTRDINEDWIADVQEDHGGAGARPMGPAGWAVTCWTCHRGAAQPEARPPASPNGAPGQPPGQAPGQAPGHDAGHAPGRDAGAPADSSRGTIHRHSDGAEHRHDGRP